MTGTAPKKGDGHADSSQHGEVNYYITQILTGHGLFLVYLHKIGKVSIPACVYCKAVLANVEHTFFACNRWSDKRTKLERTTGCLTHDTILQKTYCERKMPMNTL